MGKSTDRVPFGKCLGTKVTGKCCYLNSETGLPDGIFSNQKYQFWSFLEGIAIENIGIFYVHLVYFTSI
jgi:hypothetical protein